MENLEASRSKSIGDLWREAAWFFTHTAIAICVMLLAIMAFSVTNPSVDDPTPKLIGTALAFFVPMLAGCLIAWRQQNIAACYVWISGVLIFAALCVWVIDLPTGPGLCDNCLVIDRLRRTFFDIYNGSGLIAGQGLMVGAWIPSSLIGYALGAKLGLSKQTSD